MPVSSSALRPSCCRTSAERQHPVCEEVTVVTAGQAPAVRHRGRRGARPGLTAALLLLGAVACSPPPTVHFHASNAYPERLSDWGIIVSQGDSYRLGAGVQPYELNSALFTDHALKLRTLYVPSGRQAHYRDTGPFDLPVGSIISKTFLYEMAGTTAVVREDWSGDPASLSRQRHRLLETRLLVRQPEGWDALPYVWDGAEAWLRLTGVVERMTLRHDGTDTALTYIVPSRSECASCHVTDHASGALQPIGIQARHLNRPYPGTTETQLAAWHAAGTLVGLPTQAVPYAADWRDANAPLEARVRAYLDINCGHCHQPGGPAATSGLFLDAATTDHRQLGFCKRPVAAGRGSGGRLYSIRPGAPDASILVYRMESTDPAVRMPEIGRTWADTEAIGLVRRWIAEQPGDCV